MFRRAIAVVGFLALTAPSFAATDDITFVQTAIGINLEEIALGNLAQQQSQNADVKAYGQTLVKDHTDNLTKATALAQSIGASVPGASSTEAQDMAKHLATLTGTAFDKEFLDHMVKGHQMAIQLFTDQAAGSNDVAAYAKATLPSLQQHESQAQTLLSAHPQ